MQDTLTNWILFRDITMYKLRKKWKAAFLTNKGLFELNFSDVLWIIQLARNISIDDKQYILRTLI